MKRKEAVKYLANAAEYVNHVGGSITLVREGERVELDIELVLCCVGMAFLAAKDLLSGYCDDIEPDEFVSAVIQSAGEAYGQARNR